MANVVDQRFGGDWTERKLAALSEYLHRYTMALSKQAFRLEYIDAFAGTGYREIEEYGGNRGASLFEDDADEAVQRFLEGSAARALQVSRPFHHYKFVELSGAKASQLEQLRSRHPDLAARIEVVRSDANQYLAARATENWLRERRRAVVFVDPFGMQVDWTTISALAATKAVDLWLLYPVSAINRLLSQSGVRFESWRARLDRVFGGPDWFDAFYKKSKAAHLFEPSTSVRFDKVIDIEGLTRFMVSKLDSTFAQVVKQPLVLKSSKGSPLFALCFAAANPVGAPIACRIAKHILEN